MDLQRLAEQVAGFYVPVLAFTLIRRQLHCVAVRQMKSLVNIQDALHPVIARGQIVQAHRWISERRTIESRRRAGSKSIYIYSESLLRVSRVKAELEARLFVFVVGDKQHHVAVKRRSAHLFRK